MDFVRLGTSGLNITTLTYGTALTIGSESNDTRYSNELIDTAWNCGIRSFDTSNNYGNGNAEIHLGNALKKYPRHQYVISTKGSWPIGSSIYEKGLSRKHLCYALESSLSRLKMDYVDIYYAHRYDPNVPMIEIIRTFNHFINRGKILYWATSEWPLDALKECIQLCEKNNFEKPITEQFIYSYAVQKSVTNGVKDFCQNKGIGTICFSPLCQGYLTGKYLNSIPKNSRIAKAELLNYNKTQNFYVQNKERIDFFLNVCKKYETDPSAVALQWCFRQKIYPVFGASTKKQIEDNVAAATVRIPEELWMELEKK